MAVADTDINIAELTENGGGGGGVLPDLVQEITYNDLKQKRDNGTLMVGVWYRITDYHATTSQEYTKAANKRFDILALAVAPNNLSEECRVLRHSGSNDFEGRDLSAWKIWYRLDNDPKFAWWCDGEMYRTQKYGYDLVMKYVGTSDEEPGYQHKFFARLEGSYISVYADGKEGNVNVKFVYPTWSSSEMLYFKFVGNIDGKGIIYRMIDEFDNDLPYDFQNMQFARNKIITHNVSEFVGSYAVYKDGHSYNYTVDPETEYLFTFHNCFERKKEVCKNYFPPIYRNLNSNYEAFLGGNVFVESRCNCNEIKSDWFRDNTVNFGEFIGVTSLSASISENLIKKANNLTIRGSYFSYNNILSLTNLVSEFSFTNSNILGSSNIKANYTVEGITLNKNVDNLIVDTNIQSAYGDILSIPANDRRNKVAYRNPADPYDRNIMIRYTDDNQGSTAKDTTYDNSKSGLNANNTQDAIDELGGNLGWFSIKHLTIAPTDMTLTNIVAIDQQQIQDIINSANNNDKFLILFNFVLSEDMRIKWSLFPQIQGYYIDENNNIHLLSYVDVDGYSLIGIEGYKVKVSLNINLTNSFCNIHTETNRLMLTQEEYDAMPYHNPNCEYLIK